MNSVNENVKAKDKEMPSIEYLGQLMIKFNKTLTWEFYQRVKYESSFLPERS